MPKSYRTPFRTTEHIPLHDEKLLADVVVNPETLNQYTNDLYVGRIVENSEEAVQILQRKYTPEKVINCFGKFVVPLVHRRAFSKYEDQLKIAQKVRDGLFSHSPQRQEIQFGHANLTSQLNGKNFAVRLPYAQLHERTLRTEYHRAAGIVRNEGIPYREATAGIILRIYEADSIEEAQEVAETVRQLYPEGTTGTLSKPVIGQVPKKY